MNKRKLREPYPPDDVIDLLNERDAEIHAYMNNTGPSRYDESDANVDMAAVRRWSD